LTGPEKTKLFNKINIVTLFPALQTKAQLQELWSEFFRLVNMLGKSECDATAFDLRAKTWVRLFTSVYQSKDVTPYMHAFAMHVSEFLRLYGNIVMFTQQGLEKLNDVTTVQL
jgi:ubiquinone/menaquinone biosynthesis C-methylase UbiE